MHGAAAIGLGLRRRTACVGGRCESLGPAKRARVSHSSEADNRRHLPLRTLLNRPQPVFEVSCRPLCIEGYFTPELCTAAWT